jgi:trans-aconitate 2-methyltransferase
MSPGAWEPPRGTSQSPGEAASARDWDAVTYDRVSGPQVAWAGRVLDRLPLAGDETVLGERATVFQSDLQELTFPEPVDAVFSNAVFHWVPDHDRLFQRLFAALKPGGRLVAQCGGAGNVERFHAVAREVALEEPYAEHLGGWRGPWNFATAEATRDRLLASGFTDVTTWLEPSPVHPPEPLEYLRTVCLGHHLAALPERLRGPYAEAVAKRCGTPLQLDYVRLNITARRPA